MAKREMKTAADYAAAHRAIQDKIDGIFQGIKGATQRAVTDVAIDILSRSVERAPIEFGDLRGSGYAEINDATVAMGVEGTSFPAEGEKRAKAPAAGDIEILGPPGEPDGNVIRGEVGYTAPHAFVQHEHTEFNHPIGGQAKFLESIIVENVERYRNQVIESAKSGARGKGV